MQKQSICYQIAFFVISLVIIAFICTRDLDPQRNSVSVYQPAEVGIVVVSARTDWGLNKKLQKYLKVGWERDGELQVTNNWFSGTTYIQVLRKKKE